MTKRESKELDEAQRISLTQPGCEAEHHLMPINQGSNYPISSGPTIPVEGNGNRADKTSTPVEQAISPKAPKTADPETEFGLPAKVMLLLRRLIALAIDQLICLCLAALLLAPPWLVAIYFVYEAPFKIPTGLQACAILAALVCTGIAYLLTSLSYCAKFESSRWQATPGKLLMGLRVVDDRGKIIKYGYVIERLFIQGLIISFLGPCLAGLSVACLFALHLAPNAFLTAVLPIAFVVACYFISLFTPRGQTLLDIALHRIVECGPDQIKRRRLLEGIDILFTNRLKERDWLLIYCTRWALTMCLPCLCILPLISYALIETDQAVQVDAGHFQTSPHYLRAERWFKRIDSLYVLASWCHRTMGDQTASVNDLRKATIIAPNNWGPHFDYGLGLEAQGNLKAAKSELSKALSLTNKGNEFDDDKSRTKTESPEDLSVGGVDFSIIDRKNALLRSDLYLKLGKLSNQLAQYKEAVGYLDKAIEMDKQDPQKYLARSDAYRALGNIRQAELDKDKADSMFRVDMATWRMQLKRTGTSGAVEVKSQEDAQ